MRHVVINIAAYPPPDAIDSLDYEAGLAARRSAFLTWYQTIKPAVTPAELAEMEAMLTYEYEPLTGLLEADATMDMVTVARMNDKVRAVMLATATGTTLDHLGATPPYRVIRRTLVAANPSTGTAAVMEDDDTYRMRIALSPASWSCAGPEGAYIYFAISASGDVLDVAAYSEDVGACLAPYGRLAILARAPDGSAAVASQALCDTVAAAVNRREIRPFTDRVFVEAASLLTYQVAMTLMVRPGSSVDLVTEAVRKKVLAYTSGRIRWAGDGEIGPVDLVGRRIRLGTLAAAASVDGVEEVIVTSPAQDVNAPAVGYDAALPLPIHAVTPLAAPLIDHLFRAPICMGIALTVIPVTEGWTS